jgi:predicted ATPase
MSGNPRGIDFAGFLLAVEQRRDENWEEGSFPYNLPAVSSWDRIKFHEAVTFLVGENGSGKSTVIEAIAEAIGFNPEGGSKDHAFSTNDTHTSLSKNLRLIRSARREKDGYFLRAETFYTQSTYIDRTANPDMRRYGGKKLLGQSHGEGMMALFWHRFGPNGLYILDEPEAALSPQRQFSFLVRLHELVQQGCQFIIATHSPILMAYPDALIYQIDEMGLLPTDWDNVEHVDTTRQFLKNPESFLRVLLEDED